MIEQRYKHQRDYIESLITQYEKSILKLQKKGTAYRSGRVYPEEKEVRGSFKANRQRRIGISNVSFKFRSKRLVL